MGDISDMMLDGTVCAACGAFESRLEGAEGGPKLCDDCLSDPVTARAWGQDPQTLVTGLHCSRCLDFVYSRARHDFRCCSCGAVFVDGGFDYFRCGHEPGLAVRSERKNIGATPKQLYDDWNKSEDKFGLEHKLGIEHLAEALNEEE